MHGSWLYQAHSDTWCLYANGRTEITVRADVLAAFCAKHGVSRREALTWMATRPTKPFVRSAA